MNLTLPVIIIIVMGIVALNIIVGLTIFIFRRRSVQAERKRGFIVAPYSKPPPPPPTPSQSMPAPSYPELLMSVNAKRKRAKEDARRASSQRTSRGASKRTSLVAVPSPPLMAEQQRLSDVPELSSSESTPVVPGFNLRRGPSIRSADSISMYSTASAPLAFHERILQSSGPIKSIREGGSEDSHGAPSERPSTKPSTVHWKPNKRGRSAAVQSPQERPRLRIDTVQAGSADVGSTSRKGPVPLSHSSPEFRSYLKMPNPPPPVAAISPSHRRYLSQKVSSSPILSPRSPPPHVELQPSDRPPNVPLRSPLRTAGHVFVK